MSMSKQNHWSAHPQHRANNYDTKDHAATWDQIVRHFLNMKYEDMTQGNWHTSFDNSVWDVNRETYINGILLTVDHDYEMGWLIEVVDREPSTVSYGVIVTWPSEYPNRGHDSIMYPEDVGTFFDRNVDSLTVCQWAVSVIHGLLEGRRGQ